MRVRRPERTGRLDRFYLSAFVSAIRVSCRSFFRNLMGRATGTGRGSLSPQFPGEGRARPVASRGMPVLVEEAPGTPRCTACGDCELSCPADCIRVVPSSSEGTDPLRVPEVFELDMALCTWCGLCEEVCPEEAIVMSSVVEVAAFDRDSMVFRKSELMVPEELVIQRLEFVRRNRARQASAGR